MLVRRLGLCATVLLAGACASIPPSAKTNSEGSTSICLDTLHAIDSIASIVTLNLRPQDSATSLPPDYEDLFADELRSRFHPPHELPLSVVAGAEPCDSTGARCLSGALNLAATAYFTAHHTGKLTHISVVDATLTPALADSLRIALERVSHDETTGWVGRPDSIPMQLEIVAEDSPDSISVWRRMFKSIVPHYNLPFSSAAMPASGVNARYPLAAQLAGAGDTVVVVFTVDAEGQIVPSSIDLVSARYRDFVVAVAEALSRTRYHPARLGDCAVATRMRQRFVFTSR